MVLELAQDVAIAEQNRNALAEQLMQATNGVWDTVTAYLGYQLGLYEALVEIEPATSVDLAARTSTNERYVREWLEQQTVAGFLQAQNPEAEATERRYVMPPGHADVLVDRDSLYYSTPMTHLTMASVAPLPALLAAFRTGDGIPYADYGADFRESMANVNRNLFLQLLGGVYLPSIADIDARLKADPPARVADIGCGLGWSSIGMAKAYPRIKVDGFDLDRASVAAAQANIWSSGVESRVSVEWRDAGDPTLVGQYDLVTAFACVHDMSDPVGALRTMRRLTKLGGSVLIGDHRIAQEFLGEGNDVERILYGYSITHCLPVGMAEQPSAGTGTIMRPSTLRDYALEAGFQDVEILPINDYLHTFYRLILDDAGSSTVADNESTETGYSRHWGLL